MRARGDKEASLLVAQEEGGPQGEPINLQSSFSGKAVPVGLDGAPPSPLPPPRALHGWGAG